MLNNIRSKNRKDYYVRWKSSTVGLAIGLETGEQTRNNFIMRRSERTVTSAYTSATYTIYLSTHLSGDQCYFWL